MYVVVAGIGFPAAFRNLTAFALVASWLAGEIVSAWSGNSLPVSFYFMADVAVISLIYAKTIRRVGNKTYPTLRRQLYCLIVDLTPWDRWIVGLFLLGAWPLYVLSLHPFYKWWALFAIVIAQFLLAGAEAISSIRHELSERASSDPPGNGFALAGYWRDG